MAWFAGFAVLCPPLPFRAFRSSSGPRAAPPGFQPLRLDRSAAAAPPPPTALDRCQPSPAFSIRSRRPSVARRAAHVACAGGPSGFRYGLFGTGQSEVNETVPTCRSRCAPLGTLRYAPRHTGPASDRYVDVSRIDVEAAKAPSHPLGSNECRPRAEEEVEDEVTATRHVLDRIGHQSAGLDRRMQGQILATATLKRIDGGIVPDVGAIASVLAQLHRVEMRHVTDPEYENQLVFRAIERPHFRIGLIPDADVQKGRRRPPCRPPRRHPCGASRYRQS